MADLRSVIADITAEQALGGCERAAEAARQLAASYMRDGLPMPPRLQQWVVSRLAGKRVGRPKTTWGERARVLDHLAQAITWTRANFPKLDPREVEEQAVEFLVQYGLASERAARLALKEWREREAEGGR